MARIYTTRQLLDPRYVDMMNQAVNRRLDMASQDRANLLGSLSKTVGAASLITAPSSDTPHSAK